MFRPNLEALSCIVHNSFWFHFHRPKNIVLFFSKAPSFANCLHFLHALIHLLCFLGKLFEKTFNFVLLISIAVWDAFPHLAFLQHLEVLWKKSHHGPHLLNQLFIMSSSHFDNQPVAIPLQPFIGIFGISHGFSKTFQDIFTTFGSGGGKANSSWDLALVAAVGQVTSDNATELLPLFKAGPSWSSHAWPYCAQLRLLMKEAIPENSSTLNSVWETAHCTSSWCLLVLALL